MAKVIAHSVGTAMGFTPGATLLGLSRCPHCGIASPNMKQLWSDVWTDYGEKSWAAYRCNTCSGVVCCVMTWNDDFEVENIWPSEKVAHVDIPEPARNFLKQAFDTLHAPDAAAVMAGSAVDAMLKNKRLREGSLYSRIDEALKQGILTEAMADWAHSVRLGSNRPRHADENNPHVSPDEAKQSVEFAEALGQFLFVLTARIQRGIDAAKAAAGG